MASMERGLHLVGEAMGCAGREEAAHKQVADAEAAAESARQEAQAADARAASAEAAKIELSLQVAELASGGSSDHAAVRCNGAESEKGFLSFCLSFYRLLVGWSVGWLVVCVFASLMKHNHSIHWRHINFWQGNTQGLIHSTQLSMCVSSALSGAML